MRGESVFLWARKRQLVAGNATEEIEFRDSGRGKRAGEIEAGTLNK